MYNNEGICIKCRCVRRWFNYYYESVMKVFTCGMYVSVDLNKITLTFNV